MASNMSVFIGVPLPPICVVLQVDRDGSAGLIAPVWAASVDGEAVVKADFARLEFDGNLDDLGSARYESLFQTFQVVAEEVEVSRVVGPAVATIDHADRSHLCSAVVERNPGGEHLGRGAGFPIAVVGVPTDPCHDVALLDRLVKKLVVPEANAWGSTKLGGNLANDRASCNGR